MASPYVQEVTRDPGRLRIAYTSHSFLGMPIDAEAVRAVENTARLLASLGHYVEPRQLELDGESLGHDFLRMWFAHMAVFIDDVRARTGCGPHEFELDTIALASIGRSLAANEYMEGHLRWHRYALELGARAREFDSLLSPTVAGPAPRVGEVKTPEWLTELMRRGLKLGIERLIPLARKQIEQVAFDNLRHVPFTQLANLTGVPAASVPMHTCANGLPLGVQLIADSCFTAERG